MGTANAKEISSDSGIIPRACVDLFDTIHTLCDGNAQVELSYLELYNEELRDLMAETSKNNTKALKIRETLSGEVYVSGAAKRLVTSPAEIGSLMEEAAKRRVVAATQMNAVSSRSHAICTLRIQGVLENTTKFESKLTLVDLAGSERIKKTGAVGARQTEGININKSLLILGQVVSALSDTKHRRKPPYRDSKLTRLLQDSLGGNSRTIMLACVSPAECNLDEGINTLRYAASARNIKNTATRNIVQNITPEEAAKLQRENQLLQTQVKELKDMLQKMAPASDDSSAPAVIEDSVDSDNDNAAELRAELASVKKQLELTKLEAQKSIEVPGLHLEVAKLKEQLQETMDADSEIRELQQELEEAKADAESARMAASYLSDIVDSLREIKRDELERKILHLTQIEKERHWISFVTMMLTNYQTQVSELSREFQTKVVQAVENLEFVEDQNTILQEAVRKKRDKPRFQRLAGDAEDLLRHAMKKKTTLPGLKRWLGGEGANDEPAWPWRESTIFFSGRLKELEDSIQWESESLQQIQDSLDSDFESLRKEIGTNQLEFDTLDTSDSELVGQLTSMLLGKRDASLRHDDEEEEDQDCNEQIPNDEHDAIGNASDESPGAHAISEIEASTQA